MEKIFQYLKSKELISNNRVQKASINKLSKMQILDVASELTTLAQAKHDNSKKSIFSHCASLSLSGSREECCYLGCRQTRLEHLARFATLYSDRVYIGNHFSDYEHLGHRDADKLKQILSDDLHLILHIRPLLEKGFQLCPLILAPNSSS